LVTDYLEKGAMIMTKYYIAFLDKLKQQLVSKHRGKLWKGILSFQDNVAPLRAAIAHQKLANLLCEFVKHPAQTTVTSLTSRKESF
jgi:hypothetical protein